MEQAEDFSGSGLQIAIGTYEEGLAMVGAESSPRFGAIDVSEAMIQLFCTTTEDANASYWDRDFATRRWGGIIAPPAMLMTWVSGLFWSPPGFAGGDPGLRPVVLRVPLPGRDIINSRQMADIVRPAIVGERLMAYEKLEAISAEKRTHLGVGHFVTTMFEVQTLAGEHIGTVRNIALRYNSWPSADQPQA